MTVDLKDIWISVRPKEWVKNLFLFAALIFSRNLFDLVLLIKVGAGFVLFSIAASSIYIFNDVMDIAQDQQHPEKFKRPIAAGRVRIQRAYAMSASLAFAALPAAYLLNPTFFGIVAAFLAINVAYSLRIKEIVILDVMCIAGSFVLRVLAGTALVGVRPSDWLILCTIMVALFLGFCKRRHEIVLMKDRASNHRGVLVEYGVTFLDQMISVATAGTIITYALYTVSNETVVRFGTRNLVFTVPFVIYGVYRYLYLVHQKTSGGNPASLVLSDTPLLVNAILWLGAILYILY
jgi:4-hydroxybenzoate polyprenyltransferase